MAINRRYFLKLSSLSAAVLPFRNLETDNTKINKPIVLSTWDVGLQANKVAWKILQNNGKSIDAVEKAAMEIEATTNCCVGLGANPDREGIVTLDACIMDEFANCGSVAFLERIKHPIAVARRVMEKTPHVMLVGEGAQQFALQEGFILESNKLSKEAEKAYKQWLKKSEYAPVINIEQKNEHGPFAPSILENGNWNHDTVGIIALDSNGNLSGSCTTSGMGFKMRGRLGDSSIIGAGLFVDNKIGAATATGQGEDIMRVCGTHLVVEMMRNGLSPTLACKKAVERIIEKRGISYAKKIQAGFIAINKKGEYGGFAIQKGFSFAVCTANTNNLLVKSKYIL